MKWEEIDDILFDGTEAEIKAVKCPDCGGRLEFKYWPKSACFQLKCTGTCGHIEIMHGLVEVPNCIR